MMIEEQNEPKPIKKFGRRNFFCRHYSDCLDYAVLKQWRNFACPAECMFIRDKTEVPVLLAVNQD